MSNGKLLFYWFFGFSATYKIDKNKYFYNVHAIRFMTSIALYVNTFVNICHTILQQQVPYIWY